MRAALKERFHLAIHEQTSTGRIYELVVAKNGPRLRAAVPGAALPVGEKLADDGVRVGKQPANGKTLWERHALTMQDLVGFLNIVSQGDPVRDKTGLTGHDDFTFQETDLLADDENHVCRWPIDHLGLRLKAGTESSPNFVVDHIEKATPN